jgi:hypothetical protein
MNREEIDWITQNLFVGNRLWETNGAQKGFFDLREIKVPIILFASLGDNITPPQQAFNWVADVYESTDEIKARGQTIVGLLHQDIGHLGIFVSGKVAKKEHTQIVSVLKSIEALPPGLYGMKIIDQPGSGGKPTYTVEFVEYRLEDVMSRLNRLGGDEKAFDAAAMISDFNRGLTCSKPVGQVNCHDPLPNWSSSSTRSVSTVGVVRMEPVAWLAAACRQGNSGAPKRSVADDQTFRQVNQLPPVDIPRHWREQERCWRGGVSRYPWRASN